MKILALEPSYHALCDPLPHRVSLVTEPEADVEIAVFGIDQKSRLDQKIKALRIKRSKRFGSKDQSASDQRIKALGIKDQRGHSGHST